MNTYQNCHQQMTFLPQAGYHRNPGNHQKIQNLDECVYMCTSILLLSLILVLISSGV